MILVNITTYLQTLFKDKYKPEVIQSIYGIEDQIPRFQ